MAYRKTERVLAEIESRRTLIVKTSLDIIKKDGIEALTSRAIAEQSGLSAGLIFRHFPDMTELRAFLFGEILALDLELIRAGSLEGGIREWALKLGKKSKTTAALASHVTYRRGVRRELAKLLDAEGCESPAMFAAVICGAVLEAAGSLRPGEEVGLSAGLLRAAGIRARERA